MVQEHIKASDLNELININDPYAYSVKIDIVNNQDEQKAEIMIGTDRFIATDIMIRGIDDAGKNVIDETANQFIIKITTEDGTDLLYKDGCSIGNIKELMKSLRFKGLILNPKEKYTVFIKSDIKPSANISTFNIRFYIDFIGYRMRTQIGM